MSMICNLRRASDEQINHLLKHPQQITEFLYGPEENKPSFWQRLFGGGKKITEPTTNWTEPSEEEQIDLDKAWHGLHYLLTGTA
jgi:hypothetical protein